MSTGGFSLQRRKQYELYAWQVRTPVLTAIRGSEFPFLVAISSHAEITEPRKGEQPWPRLRGSRPRRYSRPSARLTREGQKGPS